MVKVTLPLTIMQLTSNKLFAIYTVLCSNLLRLNWFSFSSNCAHLRLTSVTLAAVYMQMLAAAQRVSRGMALMCDICNKLDLLANEIYGI